MKCTEIRELIASDYLDGEIEGDARGEVARHLEACLGCRQFEGTVRRAAVDPFRGAPRDTAPASLWLKVQRGIAREQERGVCAALTRAWRSLRFPAYAAASAAAAALIAVFLARAPFTVPGGTRAPSADTEELQAYLQEQLSSLASHGNNGPGESSSGETADGSSSANYGTLVEEYLM
ncbi:MAG: zf-HC2 domain-containing protein [Chlamydiota bacterium]